MSDTNGAAAPASEQAVTEPAASEQAKPDASVQEDAATDNTEASSDQETETPETAEVIEAKKSQSRSERYRRKISAQAGVIDRIESERQELTRELEGLRKAKASETAPNPADFPEGEYSPAFIAKLAAHESLKAVNARLDQQANTEAQERQRQANFRAAKTLDEGAGKLRERIPDFDQTLKAFVEDGGEFAPHVRTAINSSGERGPLLMYQLAKDADLVDRLNAMSPQDAFLEIGELRAKATLPQGKKQTQAPTPLTPLRGGASPPFDPFKSDDMDAYVKWRKHGGGTKRA